VEVEDAAAARGEEGLLGVAAAAAHLGVDGRRRGRGGRGGVGGRRAGGGPAGGGEEGGLPWEEAVAVGVSVLHVDGGDGVVGEGPEDIAGEVVEEADAVGVTVAAVEADDLAPPVEELGGGIVLVNAERRVKLDTAWRFGRAQRAEVPLDLAPAAHGGGLGQRALLFGGGDRFLLGWRGEKSDLPVLTSGHSQARW
jgi:hypothetical protein